jgi:arylsulfatase A-like enzyme
MGEQEHCDDGTAGPPPTAPSAEAPPTDGGVDVPVVLGIAAVAAAAIGAGVEVTRRRFFAVGLAAGAAAVAVPTVRVAAAQRSTAVPPNIVWFRSEDNGAEFIGAYGNPQARTPNIDQLAAEGVRFDKFFTTSPVCAPTKLGWATGMYEAGLGPGQHMRAQGRRPDFAVGFATWLAEAGYWCTTSGNTDYNTDLQGVDGFDDTTGDWQSAAREGRPFVALLGTSTSHEVSMSSAEPVDTDPAQVDLPVYVPDDVVLRDDRAAYLDRVAAMDQEVGALLAELEELGVADRTIVIYSSDHGGVLPRSKRFCYDSGLHAPLVMRFPADLQHLAPGGPGSVIDTPVSSIDAAPTMLHLAGVEIPSHFQGTPFAGPTCAPRTIAFGNRNRMDEAIDFVRTARDERYRYIRNYMPHLPWGQHVTFMWGQAGYRQWEAMHLQGRLDEVQDRFWGEKPAEELYDLDADPDEVRNLVDDPDHRGRLDELRAALDEHMVAINDNGFIPEGSAAEGYDQSRAPGAYPLEQLMDLGALAIRRDPDQLGELVDALGDPNPIVRYWGALGCSMLGVDAEPASDTLRAHAVDATEDRWVRVQSADALARAGVVDDAVAVLAQIAADAAESFPTRLQAVRSLTFIGPDASSTIDVLAAATADPNEYVSAAATHGVAVLSGTYTPAP